MAMLLHKPDASVQIVPEYDSTAEKKSVGAPAILPIYRLFDASFQKQAGDVELAPLSRWRNTLWLLRIFDGDSVAVFDRVNRVINYGNVLKDVRDPLVIFNAYDLTRTLSGFGLTGVADGLTLVEGEETPVAPPNSPLPDPLPSNVYGSPAISPRGQLLLDVAIDADDDHSTIAVVASGLDSGIPFSFSIQGARAVLMQYLPDWRDNPPRVRHSYKTDVFQSDHMLEQRTTTYQPVDIFGGERFGEVSWRFEFLYKTDGLVQCNKLFHRLARARHRRTAVPFATSPLVASVDAAGATSITPVNMTPFQHIGNLEVGGEIVRLDKTDPDFFETRNVVSITSTSIEVDEPWSKSIHPKHQTFYSVIFCTVESVARRNQSDTHQTIEVVYESI